MLRTDCKNRFLVRITFSEPGLALVVEDGDGVASGEGHQPGLSPPRDDLDGLVGQEPDRCQQSFAVPRCVSTDNVGQGVSEGVDGHDVRRSGPRPRRVWPAGLADLLLKIVTCVFELLRVGERHGVMRARSINPCGLNRQRPRAGVAQEPQSWLA